MLLYSVAVKIMIKKTEVAVHREIRYGNRG